MAKLTIEITEFDDDQLSKNLFDAFDLAETALKKLFRDAQEGSRNFFTIYDEEGNPVGKAFWEGPEFPG